MRPLPLLTVSAATLLALASPSSAAQHVSLRIIQATAPDYPITNDTANLPEGEVHVVVCVTAAGVLEDWLVTRFTHAAFADAAVAAVKEWRFEPAQRDGAAIGVRREIVFRFEPSKTVVSFVEADQLDRRLDLAFGPRFTNRVVSARELDQPLAPTNQVRPRHPAPGAKSAASVVLDYFVDDEGRPRMPIVVRADSEDYASAALVALEQTRFAAPSVQGRPTAVRVRQEFRFAAGS